MAPSPAQQEKSHVTGVQISTKGSFIQWLWDELSSYTREPDSERDDATFRRHLHDRTFPDDDDDGQNFADRGPCLQCIIQNNNPRVHYEGQWVLNQDRLGITHSTTTPDSTVSLAFNGTGITVFGTVPSSNSTRTPPTIIYRIDASESVTLTQPITNTNVRRQPLFSHIFGSEGKEHEINIRFLRGNAPFILENFFVFPQQDDTVTRMNETDKDPYAVSHNHSSLEGSNSSEDIEGMQDVRDAVKTIRILSGILGVIIFFIIAFLVHKLWKRHKRRWLEMLHKKQPSVHATESLYTHFTGTDTILRYTPPNLLWPNTLSRSEGRRSSIAKSSMMPVRQHNMMPSIIEPPLPPPKTEIDTRPLPRHQTTASWLSCP